MVLAGDIGGTKTLLCLLGCSVGERHRLWEQRFASQSYDNFDLLLETFLSQARAQLPSFTVEAACLAIAGAVIDGQSQLTNLNWHLDAQALGQKFAIPQMSLVNDFVAVGYGTLTLPPSDLYILQAGVAVANAPKAILGVGTGLGEAYIVLSADGPRVFASEGSHGSFAPTTPLESELLTYLWQFYPRVSIERVVSGQGIPLIYQFLRDRHRDRTNPELEHLLQQQTTDPAAAIAQYALDHRDALALQTMELFISCYGAEAGDLALKILACGGVYLAGGITPKILPLLTAGPLLSSFHHKGRFRSFMERIPLMAITNPDVGLLGASYLAQDLMAKN
ncbi:MAG: glucokinase [Oscillatoriales cyanobacterium SM2_2_1]|nr:glucokinase [Oscillatoriales cyanobacterium SM2_2_1]